jgi:hypothetical protein
MMRWLNNRLITGPAMYPAIMLLPPKRGAKRKPERGINKTLRKIKKTT